MGIRSHCVLAIATLGLVGCGNPLSTSKDAKPEAVFQTKIQKFSSCDEMNTVIQSGNDFYNSHLGARPALSEAVPTSDNSLYDTQSTGVQESDRVLMNDKNIFVLRNESLEILNRANFKHVKSISLLYSNNRTMLVTNSKILLVGNKDYNITTIHVLNAGSFQNELESTLAGAFRDVRMVQDRVIIMTNSYPYGANIPMMIDDSGQNNFASTETKESPNCQDIYYPQVNAFNSERTYLYGFSLNSLQTPPAKAGFLGHSDVMYMTDSSLYLFNNSYYSFPSYVRKIVWNNDAIELKAVGKYEGTLLNRWAVNEINETSGKKLVIASHIPNQFISVDNGDGTISTSSLNNSGINKIFIFTENNSILVKHSESDSFAANETIRSVRYIDNLAYVVTFRTTDPLFIFDLQDTGSIKKLGELKVPGFSTHLRPLSNNDLIGIGYDTVETSGGGVLTKGVQVSLFDVSNSSAPERAQVFTLGDRGSSSAAQEDAHALMYDQASGLIALPIVEWLGTNSTDPWAYGQYLNFAGAHVYRYQNRTLVNVGRISHSKWRLGFLCQQWLYFGWWSNSHSPDITRIVTIDNTLVSISQFGVMTHNSQNLSVITEQPFAQNSKGFCSEPVTF